MGLWLLTDEDCNRTVMYDSVSETPFGPGFYSREEAEDFGNWLELEHGISDARCIAGSPELIRLHGEWLNVTHDGWGNFVAREVRDGAGDAV